jgi:hypothetical protein
LLNTYIYAGTHTFAFLHLFLGLTLPLVSPMALESHFLSLGFMRNRDCHQVISQKFLSQFALHWEEGNQASFFQPHVQKGFPEQRHRGSAPA